MVVHRFFVSGKVQGVWFRAATREQALLLGLRGLRVLPPLASTPVGEHGCRPPLDRPSPPPIGWGLVQGDRER